MKIDQNTMIIGGALLILAGGVWFVMNGPCGFHDPCPVVDNILGKNKLTPGDETEQAAMYADYY